MKNRVLTAVVTAAVLALSLAGFPSAACAAESQPGTSARLERVEKELKSAEENYKEASAVYVKAKQELESAAAQKIKAQNEYEKLTAGNREETDLNVPEGKNVSSLLENGEYTLDEVTSNGFVYVQEAQNGSDGFVIQDGEVPLAGLPDLSGAEDVNQVLHFPWVICIVIAALSSLFYICERKEQEKKIKQKQK